MRPLLHKGKVLVTNWHLFAPESGHVEGGKSYAVVNKGPEGPDAFARRVLGDLYDHAARHPGAERRGPSRLAAQAGRERRPLGPATSPRRWRPRLQEATVWVNGLDTLNHAVRHPLLRGPVGHPLLPRGSGYVEGAPFPWLVSDFGLVDAIESGIVKIPRLPVSDTTGRPEPKYFRLWQHITENLQPGERLPGRGAQAQARGRLSARPSRP